MDNDTHRQADIVTHRQTGRQNIWHKETHAFTRVDLGAITHLHRPPPPTPTLPTPITPLPPQPSGGGRESQRVDSPLPPSPTSSAPPPSHNPSSSSVFDGPQSCLQWTRNVWINAYQTQIREHKRTIYFLFIEHRNWLKTVKTILWTYI